MVLVPQLDVVELARVGGSWRGALDVAAFERLGSVLFNGADSSKMKSPSVSAVLDFSVDGEGRPWVRGTCKLVAPILCTRCAETVDVEVESNLDFRVVETDAQAERLMPALDAVVSGDTQVPLTALVEDDILLSIPERCCIDGAKCDHASEVELVGHDAETSAAKPLEGLRTIVEGHEPV